MQGDAIDLWKKGCDKQPTKQASPCTAGTEFSIIGMYGIVPERR